MAIRILETWNGEAVDASAIPVVSPAELSAFASDVISQGARLTAFFGQSAGPRETLVTAVLADDTEGKLGIASARVGASYPSITARAPSAQAFERELCEQFGVTPADHPWLKPLRFELPFRDGPDPWGRTRPFGPIPSGHPFFAVEGEEVHEVAVGPVHAGIIEPGHFRFQCHGEHVFHLEIALGYQHRGIERMLEGGPDRRSLALVESIAGDTAVAHAVAYAKVVEALAGCDAPARGSALRGIALELERLANHVGDLGMIAGDVGFLPTASYLGAKRADYLNALAEICGNRFGRSLAVPGGSRFDLAPDSATALASRLRKAWDDTRTSAQLLFESPSVRSRTDGTGTVSRMVCRELGLVGPAARACGIPRDVRRDHPYGIYRFAHIPVASAESGDVFARAWVRFLEAEASAAFVIEQLENLPDGEVRCACGPLAPDRLVVSMVEGWRGELTHVAVTGPDGRFARYKVKDPSLHNWMGLAMALRGEQISDFPLCNKSFNLSYAGHDL